MKIPAPKILLTSILFWLNYFQLKILKASLLYHRSIFVSLTGHKFIAGAVQSENSQTYDL